MTHGHHAMHDPEFERIYQNSGKQNCPFFLLQYSLLTSYCLLLKVVQTGGWESEFMQSHAARESLMRPENYEDLERIYNETASLLSLASL